METLESHAPAPDSGDWQEPVILTEMLGEMSGEKVEALRDACHEEFSVYLGQVLDPEPVAEPEPVSA